jgi:hypothetical protein
LFAVTPFFPNRRNPHWGANLTNTFLGGGHSGVYGQDIRRGRGLRLVCLLPPCCLVEPPQHVAD